MWVVVGLAWCEAGLRRVEIRAIPADVRSNTVHVDRQPLTEAKRAGAVYLRANNPTIDLCRFHINGVQFVYIFIG